MKDAVLSCLARASEAAKEWECRILVSYVHRKLRQRGIEVSREEIERHVVLLQIREHMAALGGDVSHLTDEEIEQGLSLSSEMMRIVGATAEQAATAFMELGRTLSANAGEIARTR